MRKLSITDLDLGGKRLFLRVDFNVPVEKGVIEDDTRIRASLPTIGLALDGGAAVILASHLGRPKGKPDPSYSLRPVATRLSELLERTVEFSEDCVGPKATAAVERISHHGNILLLENLRFHPEEEKNETWFAQALASYADLYVNDAFGAAHRAHASTEGITRYVSRAAAGLLMEKELAYLGRARDQPEHPFVTILGGAKVSDKIDVIENLIGRVDALLVGGAMAYTFFKAKGLPVGRSLVEDDKLEAARSIERHALQRGIQFLLPSDHLVSNKIEEGAATETLAVGDPSIDGRIGVDIGEATAITYAQTIQSARTVIWNGPMGIFEIDAFSLGTRAIAEAVAGVNGMSIVGGGDSIAAVAAAGVADRITHISTGGGASLEFLAGKKLPGVEALNDKNGQEFSREVVL
ncbi:MAG: phosphoglycerate kinase [Acidimicrobiia bacterium]